MHYILENPVLTETDQSFFSNFIECFMTANFESYTRDSAEMRNVLFPFIFCESPYLARLLEWRCRVEENEMDLVIAKNRSSCELITAQVTSNNGKICICETQEYWHMVFCCKSTGERFIYNKSLMQTYFLQKREDVWKIWNNYNPDICSLVKEEELNTLM